MPQVQIIPSTAIDIQRWNTLIEQSVNGLMYAQYAYLNTMTNNWEAIVLDDYRAVWPLPYRKKWGFKYYYMPAFIQQLGLIGKIQEDDINTCINLIQKEVSLADLQLNFSNDAVSISEKQNRTNFIIDLNQSFESILSNCQPPFSSTYQKLTSQSNLVFTSTDDYESIIDTYYTLYQSKHQSLHADDIARFKQLVIHYFNAGQCKAHIIQSGNILYAASILLLDTKRIYNILNLLTEQGRKTQANYLLYGAILTKYSGQNLLFDFEGSDLPGVKAFYAKMQPMNQPYTQCRLNQLPWPLRLLK